MNKTQWFILLKIGEITALGIFLILSYFTGNEFWNITGVLPKGSDIFLNITTGACLVILGTILLWGIFNLLKLWIQSNWEYAEKLSKGKK